MVRSQGEQIHSEIPVDGERAYETPCRGSDFDHQLELARIGRLANQKLSQLRAAAVVSWLMKHGIKQGRLTAVGLGDKAPLADNQTEEGRAKNRRVELVK